MLRYHGRLRQVAALSRWLLEAFAALALLSWSSDRLPTALALLRRLPAVLFRQASAFLIGNVIVVTLFAKSGGHSSEDDPSSSLPPSRSDAGDAHDQRRCYSYFSASPTPRSHLGEEEEVVVYEDKANCVESTIAPTDVFPTTYNSTTTTAATSPKKGNQKCLPSPQTTFSSLPVATSKVDTRGNMLRRSETGVGACRSLAERWWPEEEEGGGRKASVVEDDNEEFRRRIEAFISKQLRFIEREEESLLLAANSVVVVAAGGPDHHRRR